MPGLNEIEKQKVWEEHLKKVATFQRLHASAPEFRMNPYNANRRMLPQPINPREDRFLDRDRASLAQFTKRSDAASQQPSAGGPTHDDDKSAAAAVHDATTASLPPVVVPRRTASGGATGKTPSVGTGGGGDFSLIDRVTEVLRKPAEKYATPQTEAQELGWYTKPLLAPDPRFRHGLKSCDVTRFVGYK